MTGCVTSFGICRAKPGREAELGRLMAELVPPTLAEPGCQRYELYRDNGDDAVWIFFEQWSSAAELEAHTQSAHFRAFLEVADECIDGAPDSFATTLVS